MAPIVEFEVFRDYLGVAATDPLVDDVSRLFDAIDAEVRRLTRREFEGLEGGSYNQVLRIRGVREFTLPFVPVRTITSIARVWFDGTEEPAYLATDYRLEDPARGLVHLRPGSGSTGRPAWDEGEAAGRGPEYVRVVWTTTGNYPADLPQAVLDWGKARWDSRDRDPGLASYQTGDDAENYFASLAGHAPRAVLQAIYGARHATGGGVV
jgi:hypothetical protein